MKEKSLGRFISTGLVLDLNSSSRCDHLQASVGSLPSVQGTHPVVPVLHEGSTCHHQSRQAGDEGRMRRWTEERWRGINDCRWTSFADAPVCKYT